MHLHNLSSGKVVHAMVGAVIVITHAKGQPWTPPPVKAVDNYDGDITHLVKWTGKVDVNRKGTYRVQATVADSSGNAADPLVYEVTVK